MFERVAKQAEWEVSFGDSLSEIPRKLVSKVSDYKLIVIYIASNDIAESNLAFLKALSPQFPFLALLDDNERFESQCVIVRRTTRRLKEALYSRHFWSGVIPEAFFL